MSSHTHLLQFLDSLKKDKVYFSLNSFREEAVTVCISVPGIRIEVEFFDDEEAGVEYFYSNGDIGTLAELETKLSSLGYNIKVPNSI